MFAPAVANAQAKVAATPTDKPAHRLPPGVHRLGPGQTEEALMLQRAIGNQATLRLLAPWASRPTGNRFDDGHEHGSDPSAELNAPSPPAARPTLGSLQPKLKVGQIDDPLEHEADRVADRVMRMLDPVAPAPTGGTEVVRPKCEACADEEERLARKETGGGAVQNGAVAPRIVHEALASPGRPLDATTRAFFEPRFGRDFSRVRLHNDAHAAESARAVGALAYTVGDHIVLSDGQARQHALLAHELAHVVQQSGAQPVLRRFAPCRHLLDAPERTPVGESDVQQAIATQAAQLGTVERELGLPGSSAAPFRTEPARGRGGEVITPQTIGEDIFGRIDLTVLTGNALELIEVKRATWQDAIFAEVQLLNYISKGNRAIRDVERIWRGRGHPGDSISSVRAMRTSRLVPETPQRIGGAAVSLAWCRDGVLSFKAIGDRDQDVFVCGVSDQGRIDAFLDRGFDPAQAAGERFISREIEARAAQAMEGMSLRDILRRVLTSPQVRRLVPLSDLPVGQEQLLDLLVQQLQPFEARIRALAQSFLHRVITELRQRVQAQIRNLLQETMVALCAKTAELTLRELLDAFDKRMRQFTLQLVPVVVEAVAAQMISELLSAIGEALVEALKYVVAAVVIVIVAILLWEVVAAIAAAEGIGAALASLGAAIARMLAQLIPALA